MKKNKFLSIFLTTCVLFSLLIMPSAHAAEKPELKASNALLIETSTGQVFYSQNADARIAPASVTKILTVLLAVEACESGSVTLYDEVNATEGFDFDITEDSSSANIKVGEVMTLEQLMYLSLVASAGDACNIIASYIGGSVSNFVDMMNRRATELGCTGTNFENTHGLPNDNHYTTCWDLSLIAREAVSHEKFTEIWGTQSYTVPATNLSEQRNVKNTNALLGDSDVPGYTGYTYENVTGGKTGFTNAAGHCLLSTAEKESSTNGNNISIMAVVMGSQTTDLGGGNVSYGHFTDSKALYEWAFESFDYVEILRSTEMIKNIPVEMASDTDQVSVRPDNSIFALMDKDTPLSTFTREVTIFSEQSGETLEAPIIAGDVLGEIIISRDGVIYGKSNLIASTTVDLSKLHYMKEQISETLGKPAVKITIIVLVILFALYLALVIRYRILRIRHTQSVREARKERAARIAQEESVRFSGSSRRESPPPAQEPEMDFFSEDEYAQDYDDYEYTEEPDPGPAQSEKDYFEEFFGRK